MNVLITGASGFVGRHLLQRLERDDSVEKIVVLVRDSAAWGELDWARELTKPQPLQGDLDNVERWGSATELENINGVFHLAAYVAHNRRERDAVFHANVDGTMGIARLAAKRSWRLVYVSTSGIVGCFRDPERIADENAPYVEKTVSGWPYYASKMEAEKHLLQLANDQGLDFVALRPPIMLGPGDHRYRSTGLLIKFLNRKLPMVIRGGFPFIDVRDAVAALDQAMRIENPQRFYHLPGTHCTVQELFADLERLSGVKAPGIVAPAAILLGIAKLDEWLGMRLRGEPLGLVPDQVVIEMGRHYWGLESLYSATDLAFAPRPGIETLKDTVEWLRENAPPEGHN